MLMIKVGTFGWINLSQVKSVESRENGAAVVHLLGGQEIALLPDEAVALESELEQLGSARVQYGRMGVETR